MPRILSLLLLLPALLLGEGVAEAVIVAAGDGTQNTTAPLDDPGWANLGVRGSLSVVYLGNRWVLTASHVGIGSVVFGSVSYDAIPGTTASFTTAPGKFADLIVFKLRNDPSLPALAIASATPATGTDVVMIGNGRNRGTALQWSGIDGWLWGAGAAMRWGTNRVGAAPANVTIGSAVTRAFWTEFTKSPPSQVTTHEAQAATGDSGGALFVKNAGAWQLGGTLFAADSFEDQPANSAFYGNRTYAVDLAFYRSAILAVTTRPACNDGIEDDGDGLTDFPNDPGCASANDLDERSPALVCDDSADNDGDTLVDFPADPGCASPLDSTESSPLDSDGDGVADSADNCPAVANPDQANTDAPPIAGGDLLGDACDADDDADGVTDFSDNCRVIANPTQCNGDGDFWGNQCDPDANNSTDQSLNALDISTFKNAYNAVPFVNLGIGDANCSSSRNALDISVFKALYNGTTPGRFDSCTGGSTAHPVSAACTP